MTTRTIRRATDAERAQVRTILTLNGRVGGCVTGIPIDFTPDGRIAAVDLFSAGCLHGRYDLHPDTEIVDVQRHG